MLKISRRKTWAGAIVAVTAATGLSLAGHSGAAGASVAQHGAITITSDADFTFAGAATGCGCVTGGAGTTSSPYVIGPWAIPAPSGGSSGWAIKVDDSGGGVNATFDITGISANYGRVPNTDPVIWLVDVHTPTVISNVSSNGEGRGVELDLSSHISLDQLSLNKMTGNSLYINGSSDITLSNSKLKSTADGQVPHNADGLYAVNSSNLRIGGVSACPQTQACNTFDYDTGWGIYLRNTHDVTIDHASANADDTGGYVFDGPNTYNVNLTNSTAEAGGPICITLNGQKTFTGYYTDLQGGLMLINGAHGNAMTGDQFAANIGHSIGSGGNGFFLNPCMNQPQPFSPAEAPMGSGNTFTNVCYSSSDLIPPLPPNPCK